MKTPPQNPPVTVVFRKYKDDGEVFALFPTIEHRTPYCTVFDRRSGHGAADYHGCIANSTPSTPAEYADTRTILEKNYGYNLKIRKRARVNFIQ